MAVQPAGPPAIPSGAVSLPQLVKPAGIADRPLAGPGTPSSSTPASAAVTPAKIAPRAGKAQNDAPDREELDRALDEVRKVVQPVAQNLLFSIDEDTGRTVVKVVDGATKEVIRQIPSEEILSIAKALDKLKGLLIKQEA